MAQQSEGRVAPAKLGGRVAQQGYEGVWPLRASGPSKAWRACGPSKAMRASGPSKARRVSGPSKL